MSAQDHDFVFKNEEQKQSYTGHDSDESVKEFSVAMPDSLTPDMFAPEQLRLAF
jgi:hypothetical protein